MRLIHIYLYVDSIVVFVYPHEKSRRVYASHDQAVSIVGDVVADESEVVHIVMGGAGLGAPCCVFSWQ